MAPEPREHISHLLILPEDEKPLCWCGHLDEDHHVSWPEGFSGLARVNCGTCVAEELGRLQVFAEMYRPTLRGMESTHALAEPLLRVREVLLEVEGARRGSKDEFVAAFAKAETLLKEFSALKELHEMPSLGEA